MEDKLRDFPKMTSLPMTHLITWMVSDPLSGYEHTPAFLGPIREDTSCQGQKSSFLCYTGFLAK